MMYRVAHSVQKSSVVRRKWFNSTLFWTCLFCRVDEAAASEPKPLFQVIQSLINKLPNGQQVMEEVQQLTYVIKKIIFTS